MYCQEKQHYGKIAEVKKLKKIRAICGRGSSYTLYKKLRTSCILGYGLFYVFLEHLPKKGVFLRELAVAMSLAGVFIAEKERNHEKRKSNCRI
ncbi:hypothetical protein DFO78_10968 [Bacillus subtilis]|nr:hypothetical protein DFO78_10968 [Bacillus subtilis]